MCRSNSSAFSLIEVAVAIAIIAILAGAVAPLAMKALNQQREQKTRENLKIAYEAMFGSRDRRMSNMRADFGYDPAIFPTDLRFMTTRTSVVPSPPMYVASPVGFSWGWNGPYWTGTVQPQVGVAGGLPADGWGRAIQLALSNGGWQLQSRGANGSFFDADDVVYPTVTLAPSQMRSTLMVNVFNKTTSPLTQITLRVQSRVQQAAIPAPAVYSANQTPSLVVDGGFLFSSATIGTQLPGPLTVSVTAFPGGSSGPLVLDLLPSETRTLDIYLH